jgi:hypothetical protein
MNKIFTLSAALMAVCGMSFAGNQIHFPADINVSTPSVQRQQGVKIDVKESQRVELSKVLDCKAPSKVINKSDKFAFKNGRLQGTGKYAAFYQPVGFLKTGIWYKQETQEFGYNYSSSIILGQTFTSYFEPTTNGLWSIEDIDLDQYSFVDSDNNFTLKSFSVPALWTCPVLTTGKASYTYGDAGLASGQRMVYPESSVFYASNGQNLPVGAYDFWCGGSFYIGYKNTPAYGSYNEPDAIWDIDETTGDTTFCQLNSNTLIIDLGHIPGFVAENLHLSGRTYEQEAPLMNGATLSFALIDYDENGVDETVVYQGTVTADDFIMDEDEWWTAVASFTEEDEDGFETSISPVIRHSAQLIISGFYQDGVDFAIPMMYSANEKGETDFPTHAYYDLIVNGEQYLDQDGDPIFTSDVYTDAVVNLYGHFTFIGGTEGEKTMEGWIDDTSVYETAEDGTKYTLAYSDTGEDGKMYYDFDYMSTFGIDYITADFDEEKILDFEADSTYYGQYGIYRLFLAVSDKLEPGETTSVKVYSNNEDYMTINITNRIGAGINNVAKDAEKEDNEVYNLQGVKVGKSEIELPAGIYVKNGKKFVK